MQKKASQRYKDWEDVDGQKQRVDCIVNVKHIERNDQLIVIRNKDDNIGLLYSCSERTKRYKSSRKNVLFNDLYFLNVFSFYGTFRCCNE